MLYVGILLWMVVAEAEVFEFGLDFVQAQSVGERCINIQGFARNLVLFVGWLRFQRAHVVQAVANLDKDNTDVIAHSEQQLFEVFCLC